MTSVTQIHAQRLLPGDASLVRDAGRRGAPPSSGSSLLAVHPSVTSVTQVRYFVCEFDEASLPWQSFRREVIGATNPAEALPGSVYQSLDRMRAVCCSLSLRLIECKPYPP